LSLCANPHHPHATIQYSLFLLQYVDVNYAGSGIGEYEHWDPSTDSWDSSACEVSGNSDGNGRCAKMDCHLEDSSTWQLLGLYKEQYYSSEWFEQLFKHAGYCIWDEDTYQFMQENYDAWPEGCSGTDAVTADGVALYLDLKPVEGANMTVALYEDSRCSVEYTGTDVDVEAVIADEGYLTGADLEAWNAAMDVYKYCQSCTASNLNDNGNNRDFFRQRQRKLDDGGYFQCDDAAGYTNVNQCMKFRSKTTMEAATYRNLRDAQQQGGLLEIRIGDQSFGSFVETPEEAQLAKDRLEQRRVQADHILRISALFLVGAGSVLAVALLVAYLVGRHLRQNGGRRRRGRGRKSASSSNGVTMSEPLVDKTTCDDDDNGNSKTDKGVLT
jgi:hypothetical protein